MAKLDFNKSPYFDDFSEVKGKNYRRILFRPSFAVQARELTQLQTNLQEQLKDITNATLDSGNVLVPGELTILTDVTKLGFEFFQTNVTYFNGYQRTDKNDSNTYIIGRDVQNSQATPTKIGKIIFGRAPSTGEDSEILYVLSKSGEEFAKADALYDSLESQGSGKALVATVKNNSDYVGKAAIAIIGAGTYYVNGFALDIDTQTIVIEDYTDLSAVNQQIGFTVTESIIDEGDDKTLLDPELESSDSESTVINAPGATRYQLKLTLSAKKFSDTPTSNEGFIELARIVNGKLIRKSHYQDTIANKDYVKSIVSQKEEPFSVTAVDDNKDVKIKVSAGSKIIDGSKVSSVEAKEFTLTKNANTISSLETWGGESAYSESGLRVKTKNGIKKGDGGSWPSFAPIAEANTSVTQSNSKVLLCKKDNDLGSNNNFVPIGSARIENVKLAEFPSKIKLDGGDIAKYYQVKENDFLYQGTSYDDSVFRAKVLGTFVDNKGNITLDVQVFHGKLDSGKNLIKSDGTEVVISSDITDEPTFVANIPPSDYTFLPVQSEFEIGLNDIKFDDVEIATLTIEGTHGASANHKITVKNTDFGDVEGTVVDSSTNPNQITVKNISGTFEASRSDITIGTTDKSGVYIKAVSTESPITAYSISDVTHLVKWNISDRRIDLTAAMEICELETSSLSGTSTHTSIGSSDELHPITPNVDREKTGYIGSLASPRLYELGKSISTVGSVSFTKVTKTFSVFPDNNKLTVVLPSDYTFDAEEPILLYDSSAGFIDTSRYKVVYSSGNAKIEISPVTEIRLAYVDYSHASADTTQPGVTGSQKTLSALSFTNVNSYYMVASVTKKFASAGTKTVTATHEYITDQIKVHSGNITLKQVDIIPDNFKVYSISKDTNNNTTWPDTTPTTNDISTFGFDVTDRYELLSGQSDSYYGFGSLKLKDGEETPGGPLWIAYYYFTHAGSEIFSISSYPVGDEVQPGNHFPSLLKWKSKKDGSTKFNYDDIPVYSSIGKDYRLSDVIDTRATTKDLDPVSPNYPLISFGGEVKVESLSEYSSRKDSIILDKDGTISYLEGPPDSRISDSFLSDIDSTYFERLKDGQKIADIEIDGYLYDKNSVNINPASANVSDQEIVVSSDLKANHIFRDQLLGDTNNKEYSVAKDENIIRPSFSKKHISFDNSSIQAIENTIYAGGNLANTKKLNLITLPEGSTVPEIVNKDNDGSLPIRYTDPKVYQGIMTITPSQYLNKSSRKFTGKEWKSWTSESDDTITSKIIEVSVEGLKPSSTGFKVSFDGDDVTPAAYGLSNLNSSLLSYLDSSKYLKTDSSGKLEFQYRVPNVNDGYITLKLDSDVSTTLSVNDVVKQKSIHQYNSGSTLKGYESFLNEYVIATGIVEFTYTIGNDLYVGLKNVTGEFKLTTDSNKNIYNTELLREDGTPSVGIISDFLGGSAVTCGKKMIKISSTDGSANAEGYFYGTDIVETDLATRNLDYNSVDQMENSIFQVIDVLDDCFAKSVDLSFSGVHSVSGSSGLIAQPTVTVQLREIVNGIPGNKSLPFSTITKSVSTTTATDAWETFTFSDFVYLKKGKYAISVSSSSTEYQLRTLDVDAGSGTRPLAVGRLYQGLDMNPSDILKFGLNRVNFTDPTHQTVTLQSSGDADWGTGDNALLLLKDSISTKLHESKQTIKIPGHGFKVNDSFQISGLTGIKETTYTLTSPDASFSTHMQDSIIYSQTINSQLDPASQTIADIKGPYGYVISYATPSVVVSMVHGQFSVGEVIGFLKSGGTNTAMGTINAVAESTAKYVNGIPVSTFTDQTLTVESVTANTVTVTGVTGEARRSGYAQGTYGATIIQNSNIGPAYGSDFYSIRTGVKTPGTTALKWEVDNKVVYPNRLVENIGFTAYDRDVDLKVEFADINSATRVSPVIDKGMIDILAIGNIIDNTGTSANYISKPVKISSSSSSLEVIVDSYLPGGTGINVYAKVFSANSTKTPSWQELKVVDYLKMGTSENRFLGKNLGDFTSYQIKISLKASESSTVPTINNLRYVAGTYGKQNRVLKTSTVRVVNESRYFTSSSHANLGIGTATLKRDDNFIEGWYEIDVPADFDVEDAEAIVAEITDKFSVTTVASNEGPITGTPSVVTPGSTGSGTTSGMWAIGDRFTITPPSGRGSWASAATFNVSTVNSDGNITAITVVAAGNGFLANDEARWGASHSGYTSSTVGGNSAVSGTHPIITLANDSGGSMTTPPADGTSGVEIYPRFTIGSVNDTSNDVSGYSDEPLSTHIAQTRIKRLSYPDGIIFPSRKGKGVVLQVRLVKNAHMQGTQTSTVSGGTYSNAVYPIANVSTLVHLKGR